MEWLAVASAVVPGMSATTLAVMTSQTLTTVSSSSARWRSRSAVARDAVVMLVNDPADVRQVLQTGANYRTHVIDLVAAGRAKNDPRPIEELRAWAADMMDRRAREGTPYFFIGLPAAVVGDDVDLVLPSYSDQHDWRHQPTAASFSGLSFTSPPPPPPRSRRLILSLVLVALFARRLTARPPRSW